MLPRWNQADPSPSKGKHAERTGVRPAATVLGRIDGSKMGRGPANTEEWMGRLAAALALSLALHVGPWAAVHRLRPKPAPRIDYQVNADIEIGLERAQQGAHTPPRPSTPMPESGTVARRPVASRSVPRVSRSNPRLHVPPSSVPSEPLEPLPEVRTELREPQLALLRRRPRLVDPNERFRETPREPDAGAAPGEQTTGDASTLPSLADVAGDMAPAVPRGSLISLFIRTDRVRTNPNAPAVRRMLANIPDWDEMLGGSGLDPLDDLDSILLAASQPFRGQPRPPDWFVLARAAHGDGVLRRAIEQMAAASRPSRFPPGSGPSVAPVASADGSARGDASLATMVPNDRVESSADGGSAFASATGDAGAARQVHAGDGGEEPGSIWEARPGGVEVATFRRYGTRRSFVLLGDGSAAVALPGQVEAFLAAMSRRPESLTSTADPRILMVLEAEGLRNLLRFPTDYHRTTGAHGEDFPLPTRAALALYEARDRAGRATGGARLESQWQYGSAAEARHAVDVFEYCRGRWRAMLDEQLGARGSLQRMGANLFARSRGVDLDAIESTIDALEARAEGSRLVLHADLSEAQVRSLLNAQAMAGAFRE